MPPFFMPPGMRPPLAPPFEAILDFIMPPFFFLARSLAPLPSAANAGTLRPLTVVIARPPFFMPPRAPPLDAILDFIMPPMAFPAGLGRRFAPLAGEPVAFFFLLGLDLPGRKSINPRSPPNFASLPRRILLTTLFLFGLAFSSFLFSAIFAAPNPATASAPGAFF